MLDKNKTKKELIVELTVLRQRLLEFDAHKEKIAEKTQGKIDAKLRWLIDTTPAAIVVHRKGEILYTNPACMEIMKVENLEQVLGRSVFEFIHPDYHQIARERLEKAERNALDNQITEEKLIRLDGGLIEVDVIGSSIVYQGKSAMQSVFFETTECKEADKAFRQLSRVAEQSTSAILITDLNGDIEFTNPAFTEMTGYTAKEVLGKNPRILKSAHTPTSVYIEMWGALLQGNVWKGEVLNKKKNGQYYWDWGSVFPVKDGSGEITHFASVKENITVRKEIELDLKESEEKFRSVVEQSDDGIILVTQSGIIIEWNRGMSNITGFSRDEVLGTLLWEVQYKLAVDARKSPEYAKRAEARVRELLEDEKLLREQTMEEGIIQRADGRICIIQMVAYPIAAKNGYMMAVVSRDITEQKEIERALEESETRFRGAFENTSVGMSLTTPEGNILKVNDALCNILGYSAEELYALTFWDFTHPDDMEENRKLIEKLLSGELSSFKLEKRYIHKDGHLVWVLLDLVLVRDEQNNSLYSVVLTQDISERKKAEAESYKLAQAVNSSGSSILITDMEGKIEFANAAFSEVSGYSTDELIGQTSRILRSGKSEDEIYADLWKTTRQGKIWRGELLNRKKNGELYWDSTVISPIKDKSGKITHYVTVRDDVTKRKEEEERLIFMATHDILTGLPNRVLFDERIRHAFALARRNNWQVALFFIDLNDFKTINDRFGHTLGDDALVEFANRLQASVRDSDTVARLSGDEFACILENVPSEIYLSLVAEKIIANLSVPFETDKSQKLQLSASIGISIFPQDGEESEKLLENADQAMYKAKKVKEKSSYNFYRVSNI